MPTPLAALTREGCLEGSNYPPCTARRHVIYTMKGISQLYELHNMSADRSGRELIEDMRRRNGWGHPPRNLNSIQNTTHNHTKQRPQRPA